MSSVGTDEAISGAKLEPLKSNEKRHDSSEGGVAGLDTDIDHSRIDPLGGAGKSLDCRTGASHAFDSVVDVLTEARTTGQGQHTAAHADSQGVIGRDGILQGAKLEPLKSNTDSEKSVTQGLDDEAVDSARIDPMGSVRESTPTV